MENNLKKLKTNNKGFTLLEVLVAMVILTVVCVPLLRSFATSAQTNAKAKLQMKSTTAAENVMEKVKNMSTDELKDITTTYSGSYSDKTIYFEINDNAEMSADLPTGYYATVELEADGVAGDYAYPNANSLNLSDFNPISVRDCAIYTMADAYDDDVYNEYLSRNAAYKAANPATGVVRDRDYFRKNLKREITLTVKNGGPDYVDAEGESHKLAKVQLTIKYAITPHNDLSSGDTNYTATDVFLFDNTASHKDLNGIYLFYYPRYLAAQSNKDIISIKNNTEIATDLYIVAMNGAEGQGDPTEDKYLSSGGGLKLDISENKEISAEGKGSLELRTNLLKVNSTTNIKTPYSTFDNNAGYGLGFDLKYTAGPVGARVTYNATPTTDPNNALTNQAIKALSVSDIDGKNLCKDEDNVRIYRLRVKVIDPEGNIISSLEGTKLKQN